MTNQEKQRMYVEKLGEHMVRYVEENSPVTREFQPHSLYMDVCGTQNLAIMKISRDILQPDSQQLRLQLGVLRTGTDRFYFNFLSAADAQETVRILRDPASHEQWLEQIRELSDKVDDFWD